MPPKNNTILKLVLFHPLVQLFLNVDKFLFFLNKRAKTMIHEMWYTMSIFAPWFFVTTLIQIFTSRPFLPEPPSWIDSVNYVVFLFIYLILFNKDFFNAQSPVHRKFGYQVVGVKTGIPASKVKCMIRNITGILWPIEVIFIFITPERRLGDRIAGTKLINVTPSDPESVLDDIQNAKFDSDAVITLLVSISFLLLLQLILPGPSPFIQ